MDFKTGDELTISRGTYRNQTAIVVEASNEKYAVKLADGTLTVINAVNVRKPAEATISASELADVLFAYVEISPEFVEALDAKVPGISAYLRVEASA